MGRTPTGTIYAQNGVEIKDGGKALGTGRASKRRLRSKKFDQRRGQKGRKDLVRRKQEMSKLRKKKQGGKIK